MLDEVIPRAVKELHADPERVAIGGISMGGFGAFDDAQDFARHDVLGAARRHPNLFHGKPVWLDAGSADPFRPGDRAFDRASSAVRLRTYRGAHEGACWRAHDGAYPRFYARALARC